MNLDQYDYYHAKYMQLLEYLRDNKDVKDIYNHLITYVKFDDIKKRIYYNGNQDELIKCYFPLAALTTKKRNKKYEQRKNYR